MDTRREFIRKAALLSGAAGFSSVLPMSVQRALAIDPAPGSTYADAEHVVILMQENRSFDHCYGMLQGVRGFNDPRAITLPNKNTVWLQRNAAGETYTPFRLNIKDTNATWMGSLPHSWADQVDARNDGKYDQWLIAKQSGNKDYSNMPLTLGYYNREDIPFYYSLADAFTVCDQNFCSSLTGTTPNRLYLWTGKIREDESSPARVRNSELDYEKEAGWMTFPERLEKAGVSWKVYQNELSVGVGFSSEEDDWLANFTDNPLEWFEQYHVRFLPAYMKFIPRKIELIEADIARAEKEIPSLPVNSEEHKHASEQLIRLRASLQTTREELTRYTPENFAKLSVQEQHLHEKAFTTNADNPDYHQLTPFTYRDGDAIRKVMIPKGDILHQFRKDVSTGALPAVSWVVAPANFSDHPGVPWYGAWYVSEVMDILTHNPEVWKKTIFILCYDENDGYFDHVPPFVPPSPYRPGTGKTSAGIDVKTEFVTMQDELKRQSAKWARESCIGLGYRVPLVIASPWSRGGVVNSQVFDHTSVLQFLEKFVSNRYGKSVTETNISTWRRTVCGDLTSVFKPYNGEKITLPAVLSRDHVIESIHKAKFRELPAGYEKLSDEMIKKINTSPATTLPRQEKGVRTASALPYQLSADGHLDKDKKQYTITLQASKEMFGDAAAGAPFHIYAPHGYKARDEKDGTYEYARSWAYAVAAGDTLSDVWPLNEFENNAYFLRVYGPNGFFREFMGNVADPLADVTLAYEHGKNKKLTGNVVVTLKNNSSALLTFEIKDHAYKGKPVTKSVESGKEVSVVCNLSSSYGWYDLGVSVKGFEAFGKRYAGHVETGQQSFSDPLMGGVVN